MKKIAYVIVGLVIGAALLAEAQMGRTVMGAFAGSGTGTNTVIIKQGSGTILVDNLSVNVSGADSYTLKTFPASIREDVGVSTAAATTNLFIRSDSAGLSQGYLIAANDYLILVDSSTNNAGYQLRKVKAVGAVTTNGWVVKNIQLVVSDQAGTASVASNDACFIVKSGDIGTRTLTSAINGEQNAAVGNYGCPLGISITSTAAVTHGVSGVYSIMN